MALGMELLFFLEQFYQTKAAMNVFIPKLFIFSVVLSFSLQLLYCTICVLALSGSCETQKLKGSSDFGSNDEGL